MKREAKLAVSIVAGLASLCCCCLVTASLGLPWFLENVGGGALLEGEAAADIGRTLVEYELPAGFSEISGTDIFGVKMILIAPEAQNNMGIILMGMPASLEGNEAMLQRQIQDAFAQQSGRQGIELTPAESETVVINGQDATLQYYDGNSQDGEQIRQGVASFVTKDGGIGMLMLFGSEENWDQESIDLFLNSLE